MPVAFNFFERLFLLKMNQGPGPMLDLVSMLAFKATLTGLKLGLFEALADGPLTEVEVAKRCGAEVRGMRFLLEALEPCGYVERRDWVWANSALTQRWLVEKSSDSIAGLYSMFDDMAARWELLPDSVRQGSAACDVERWLTERPGAVQRYHGGLKAVAKLLSAELVAKVKLPSTARRLLDLGGSHGYYSVRFCERHSALEATVFDIGLARPVAEATIAEHNLVKRIAFREGDFFRDDFGKGYDVVLLFAVARTMQHEALESLLQRIAAALNPGGQLVVMDQFASGQGSDFLRANAKLISLELLNGSPGEVHSADQVRAWTLANGFAKARFFPLRRSGGQGVVVAQRAIALSGAVG